MDNVMFTWSSQAVIRLWQNIYSGSNAQRDGVLNFNTTLNFQGPYRVRNIPSPSPYSTAI